MRCLERLSYCLPASAPARVAVRLLRPPTMALMGAMVGTAMALMGDMVGLTMALMGAMVGAEVPTVPASVFIL